MDIGANLDRIMKLRGISSEVELSKVTGVPQSTINRILQNKGSPKISTMHLIAKGCNVNMAELIDEGDAHEKPVTNLTDREIKLLTDFRAASKEGQEIIIVSAEVAASMNQSSKNPHG